MGKTRRQKNRKQFQYNVNRHKLQQKTKKKLLPRIDCDAVRESWDQYKHTKANLESMGLAYKVNDSFPITGSLHGGETPKVDEGEVRETTDCQTSVVKKLQAEADKRLPRAVRLPREVVRFVEDMMDRHGQHFTKMCRDPANHNQLTPKQIRQLVRRFWNIPEHYTPYMKRKGMLDRPQDDIMSE